MKKLLLICHIFFGCTYTNLAQNTFEKTYGSIDFSASLPFLTLLYEYYQMSDSDLFYTTHYADAPLLVNKPILSQIQSFLL